ncbi:TetR/AcrR family transcriptional regulator [Pseudomonas sp. CGJS7]|uniref:TetR/AcrR family transcriptional regulator n=1 Tax=Pseudomonas sp. CGJS7 TaxID=3109348 RepID=UPI003009F138
MNLLSIAMEIGVAVPQPADGDAASAKKPARPRGRPRAFDREAALETAMLLFWRQGYEATSLSDLTAAMGIAPPSLYSAFGSKEQLFRESMQRYLQQFRQRHGAALNADGAGARESFERLFADIAEGFGACESRAGCMLVAAEVGGLGQAAHLREELAAHRASIEAGFRARIERGQREGDVAGDTDAAELAKFLSTVVQGLSIQARDGATPAQLREVLRTALKAWPQNPL